MPTASPKKRRTASATGFCGISSEPFHVYDRKSVPLTTATLQAILKTGNLLVTSNSTISSTSSQQFLLLKGVYVLAINYAIARTFLPKPQRVSTLAGAQRRD